MKVYELVNLGKQSIEMFDQYLHEKVPIPRVQDRIRHFVTALEVSEANRSVSFSAESIQQLDWSMVIFDFMERIENLPEFRKLVESIEKTYRGNIQKLVPGGNEETQVVFWLRMFIEKVIYAEIEGGISEDSIIEYAALVRSELELSPSEYKCVYHLDGVFMDVDSLRINERVLIRKLIKDDLEYYRDPLFPPVGSPPLGRTPSAILVVEMRVQDEQEYHKYVERLLNTLRLYRLGSVYSIEQIVDRKTAIWSSGNRTGWGNQNYRGFITYTVKESETGNLIQFIERVEQSLDFNCDSTRYGSLSITLDRYKSALLEATDIDRRLMDAVMGLESLFSLKKDRGENSYKLGVRVAKMLGHLAFDAQETRRFVEEAYAFRNKVVHGVYVSEGAGKRMNEVFPKVLNYLRVSLIVFLLNRSIGKDKIVDTIDMSLVSNCHDKKLRILLEKHRSVFENSLHAAEA